MLSYGVRKNDITLDKLKDFIKTYRDEIRGHHNGHSSQSGDGEQSNTTADLLAYKSWHTINYGGR